jgi:hypothetical protein
VSRQLLGAPEVDLILGHHVHVVQPIEQVGSKWVAYGMGNSLSNQTPSCCAAGSQDGVLVKVMVSEHAGRLRAGGALCAHLDGAPELPHPRRANRPGRPVAACRHRPRPASLSGPDRPSRRPHSEASTAPLNVGCARRILVDSDPHRCDGQ